jgi:hypothetical protein
VAKEVQVAPHVLGVTGKKAFYQKPGDLVIYHNPSVEALYAPLQGLLFPLSSILVFISSFFLSFSFFLPRRPFPSS